MSSQPVEDIKALSVFPAAYKSTFVPISIYQSIPHPIPNPHTDLDEDWYMYGDQLVYL